VGLSTAAINIGRPDEIAGGKREISSDQQRLREELERRIFGARVIAPVEVTAAHDIGRHAANGSCWKRCEHHASQSELTRPERFSDEIGTKSSPS